MHQLNRTRSRWRPRDARSSPVACHPFRVDLPSPWGTARPGAATTTPRTIPMKFEQAMADLLGATSWSPGRRRTRAGIVGHRSEREMTHFWHSAASEEHRQEDTGMWTSWVMQGASHPGALRSREGSIGGGARGKAGSRSILLRSSRVPPATTMVLRQSDGCRPVCSRAVRPSPARPWRRWAARFDSRSRLRIGLMTETTFTGVSLGMAVVLPRRADVPGKLLQLSVPGRARPVLEKKRVIRHRPRQTVGT